MPRYLYRCPDGHETVERRRIAERRDPAQCQTCGRAAEMVIAPANIPGDGKYSYRHDK